MVRLEKAAACVGLAELQAYLRIEDGQEEALLAGLLRSATETCEGFTNQLWMMRSFEVELTAGEGWALVGLQPVRRIDEVTIKGSETPLSPDRYRADIDHDGRAFIKGLEPGRQYIVRGQAGTGSSPNDVPEPVRQGIVRLAATMHMNRDGTAEHLPAVVTSLWRPYRRAGLWR